MLKYERNFRTCRVNYMYIFIFCVSPHFSEAESSQQTQKAINWQ